MHVYTTIIKHFQEYCNGIFRNTGINCFWIINNSQQVIDTIQKFNTSSKAKSMDSYDFSTLYTSIPHDSLKHNLGLLIDEAYRVRGALWLTVNRSGKCMWSRTKSGSINIDARLLMAMIEYLVDNIYVHVGNRVFRQCIGIPMGTDCAPLLANLYLFYFEYQYMKKLMKNNRGKAKQFSHTVRYIDDLLTLNNPSFETEIYNIYPSKLVLKKTTESCDMLSYLDIRITILESRYVLAVYDKRDNFHFGIVNFPFMCQLDQRTVFQLVRIGRICDNYEDYVSRNRLVTTRLIKQGFRYSKLCRCFKKFSRRHNNIFNKYGKCLKQHIVDGISRPLCVLPGLTKYITVRNS